MASPPIHDFQNSIAFANTDPILRAFLKERLGTDGLLVPSSSQLLQPTCDFIINLAIKEARELYTQDAERLVCVISPSSKKNAYAIWGATRYDWIVLTEGLLHRLRDAANEAANRLKSRNRGVDQSPLGRKINSVPPMSGGLESAMSSILYASSVAFFVGHEAGHHLEGHEGHYKESHSEMEEEAGAKNRDNEIEQALEFHADEHAVFICQVVTTKILMMFVEGADLTEIEKKQYNRLIALFVLFGALMALAVIRPKKIDWDTLSGDRHPPATLRAIKIWFKVQGALQRYFPLRASEVNWAAQVALELASEGAIEPNSKEHSVFEQRKLRKELAAVRAVGIRAALYDSEVINYLTRLDSAVKPVLLGLKPRLNRRSSGESLEAC